MSQPSEPGSFELHLVIPEAVHRILARQAAKSGKDVEDFAAALLERDVSPSIGEIMAPVRADFAASGMSDDEIMELGRQELEALRNEKD